MRLLALTNALAPANYGYGRIAADCMGALSVRGHEVTFLTETGGEASQPFEVRRELRSVLSAWRHPRAAIEAERHNQAAVRRALGTHTDAVVVWHMRGIGKGSLTLAHDLGLPVLYMLGDLWVLYERPGPPGAWSTWQALDRSAAYRAARRRMWRLVERGRLRLEPPPVAASGTVCFASTWLRDRHLALGFRPRDAHVVPNGIYAGRLAPPRASDSPALRVAYVGRLEHEKGIDVALDALALIPGAELTVVGGGDTEAAAVHADGAGVKDRVAFRGALPPEGVAQVLAQSDVFLMPGRIEEGFGLVYLEAMAAGAVVVGTATGGARELCADGVNAIIVPVGDVRATASAVSRVARDTGLRERLREGGITTARRYPIGAMAERVEALVAARRTEGRRATLTEPGFGFPS